MAASVILFMCISWISTTRALSYGPNIKMVPNKYEDATLLTDTHDNIILKRDSKDDDWYSPHLRAICDCDVFKHDPGEDGKAVYHWKQQSKHLEQEPAVNVKLLLSAENFYFCGFADRDAVAIAKIDTSSKQNFGYKDEDFAFYPNRYRIAMILDASFKQVIVTKEPGDEYWSSTLHGEWKLLHEDRRKAKSLRGGTDHKIWWAYDLTRIDGRGNLNMRQKYGLTKKEDGTFEWTKIGKEKKVPVARTAVWLKSSGRPFKDTQKLVGNCVQLTVNNILGDKYWTNKQYYDENVKAYGDEAEKSWIAWRGHFSDSSVRRALAKVNVRIAKNLLKGEDCHKLLEIKDWTNVLGIRVSYDVAKVKKWAHSVAFRRVIEDHNYAKPDFGTWWFLQSWFGVPPRKMGSIQDIVQAIMKAHSDDHLTHCEVAQLLDDAKGKLIPPEQVDRSATYTFDRFGTPTKKPKEDDKPESKSAGDQAKSEYYDRLWDLEYDIEIEKARRQKVLHRLNREKQQLLQIKQEMNENEPRKSFPVHRKKENYYN